MAMSFLQNDNQAIFIPRLTLSVPGSYQQPTSPYITPTK